MRVSVWNWLRRCRSSAAALAFASLAWAGQAEDLAEGVRKIELDPEACYRVREVSFQREDLKFYLTEGVIMFAKPIAGKRLAAAFTTEGVDGGDAELLVLPPTAGERLSLSTFAGSPNLNEHFRAALFLFTDGSGEALMQAVRDSGELRPSPERGLLLKPTWDSVTTNITASFGSRLVHHLLGGSGGFFYAGIQGTKLGNFDAYHDSMAIEHIFLGQIAHRENRSFYDIWTSFPARSHREGKATRPPADFKMTHARIESVIDESLSMHVSLEATVMPSRALSVTAWELSDRMKVKSARVNGEDAAIFTSESLRANLARRNESRLFLLIPPRPLEPGRAHQIQIECEGGVVLQAGRGVYYVGSRANWYPAPGLDWTTFDLTFTHPARLQLVFPGDLKEDKTEDGLRKVRRVITEPVRMAGFNLGTYESATEKRGNLTVELYANKSVEPALRARPEAILVTPPPSQSPFPRRSTQAQMPQVMTLPAPPPPDPTQRLDPLASEIADAFQFFAQRFGPPAVNTLRVSPIPGTFGQGFPGLVYMSTLAYLNPGERPFAARSAQNQRFFSEILHAHETAHQWWGNVVTSASAQDDWLMEALANYSALMALERKKGVKALNEALEDYRDQLLRKDSDGRLIDAAGPIRLGGRLLNSRTPESRNAIIYGKGAWIMHMLRRRLGDEPFSRMLGDLARKHRHQALSTRQFQEFAAAFVPKGSPGGNMDQFFEQWVESTGIPTLALSTRVTGKAPALKLEITVTQTEAPESFSVRVPVEVQIARLKPQMVWVTTDSEPSTVTVPLRAAPSKVTLDPELAVLAARK